MVKKRRLRITDKLNIESVDIIDDSSKRKKILDNFGLAADNQKLVVRVAATHSGLLTRNNTYYTPSCMKKSAHTWTEHYNKPILTHHQKQEKDPIGRVIDARYVDTSEKMNVNLRNSIIRDSKKIQDDFKTFTDGTMPYFKQVDFITDHLARISDDPNFQGLGYIELTAVISDSDAIQKVKDGRYLTGSVSASTDKAICSVCKQDWIEEGKCDHRPGKVYDEKKAFIIAGMFEYEEWSYVNDPADKFSQNLELVTDEVSDNLEDATSILSTITDALEMDSHEAREMLIRSHDNLHMKHDWKVSRMLAKKKMEESGSSEAVIYSDNLEEPPKGDVDLHEQFHREAKKAGLLGSIIYGPLDHYITDDSIRVERAELPEMEDVNKENKLTMSDNTKLQPDEEKTAVEETVEDTPSEENTAVDDQQQPEEDKVVEKEEATVSDEDTQDSAEAEIFTQFSDSTDDELENKFNTIEFTDSDDQELSDEERDLIYELMLRDESLSDAKLSSEARKKLPDSAFCGPDRSFPVPDCSHVTAARRLVGRYDGPGSKKKIMACVDRKAKSLSCESDKKEDSVKESEEPKELKTCDSCTEKDKTIADLQEKQETLDKHLGALREEVSLLYRDYASMQDRLIEAEKVARQLKAERVADYRVLSGENVEDKATLIEELSQLEDTALNSQVDSVDIQKIVDTFKPGLANIPSETVTDPSEDVNDSSLDSNKQQDKTEELSGIAKDVKENYSRILNKRGHSSAEKYLKRMIRDGYINTNQADDLVRGGSR